MSQILFVARQRMMRGNRKCWLCKEIKTAQRNRNHRLTDVQLRYGMITNILEFRFVCEMIFR